MNTRYRIEEGSIALPDGFADRSTNIFVLGNTSPSPVNMNIARDTLLDTETLPAYVDRQIGLLKKNLRNYSVVRREATTLGADSLSLSGEQVTSTHRNGSTTIHQRQAAFIHAPQRVLILSCSSVRPFDGTQETRWQQWLASFQPATHN
ncbi:DcrB-related protein [Paraburkholderia azotifigens]|uniref:DUF1795 domain-containing protein n=1 Tax=Paraburkholderia azotifigens TaxID=2057004 RepID=A0A5C6V4Y1_9BURK|nr:DUF1795 domain-containing protein [Paraburkholderia azotifigens]TXC80119.1 DUF1795 domain-containing protein [Paraburkholderia azotifigens]